MTVQLYSKQGCKMCVSFKEKLAKLGVDYQEHELAYHIAPHQGWREDGSADLMAAHTLYGTMPLVRVEGKVLDYPGAIAELRRLQATAGPRQQMA